MKISACMIAKNEEKNIQKCIDSYKSVVDEIIVVDTGSTDNTVELAESLGAAVFSYQWENDFAKAKNFALSKAKGDWIIFLDADEYFDEESAGKIRKTLEHHLDSNVQCLSCKIVNIDIDENDKIIEESINIRTIKRLSGLCFVGSIHEEFRYNGKIPNVEFEKDLTIYHTGYSSHISKEKTLRNLSILNSLKKDKDTEAYKLDFYLAQTYQNLEEYDKAIIHIINFLKSGETFIGSVTKPYEILFRAMIETKRFTKEYDKWLEKGEALYPHQPLFSCCRAYKHLNNKEYSKALFYFEKGIELNEKFSVDSQINFMQQNIDAIYYFIGDIYEKKNDLEKAIESYIKCLYKNKFNVYSFKRLMILIRDEELNYISTILNNIYKAEEKQDMAFLMKQLSSLKIGKILLYYYTIWDKEYGKNVTYYLMTLLATNQYQEAFNIIYNVLLQSKQSGDTSDNSSLESYLVLSSIFCSNVSSISKTINIVSLPNQKILKYLSGLDTGYLTDNEFKEYYDLLAEIVSITNEDIIRLFLSINNKFSVKNLKLICNLLCDWNYNSIALNIYNLFSDNSEAQMKIAVCYYKLLQFNKAGYHFDNALKLAYKDLDINDYISWNNKNL